MNFFLVLKTKEGIESVTKQLMDPIGIHLFPTMEVNGIHQLSGYWLRHSSKYISLCSAEERNSCRFETT